MAPIAPTTRNTRVVDVVKEYSAMKEKGETLAGPQKIVSVVTVNGVRVTLEDGTWGLVRASSNKPSLVVVVESPAFGSQYAGHLQGHRHAPFAASRSRRVRPKNLASS